MGVMLIFPGFVVPPGGYRLDNIVMVGFSVIRKRRGRPMKFATSFFAILTTDGVW
jgi:hypothetical protein